MAYARFKAGLSTLGVLRAMEEHPDIMREAFIYGREQVDATCVDALFKVETWSSPGSNRHADEKRTHGYWRDFLQDLEGWQCLFLLYCCKISYAYLYGVVC